MNTELLSIKDVVEQFELSPVYVRRMIQHGKIKTTKVEIGKNTFKHMIEKAEIERWRAESVTHSRRADNRSKFVLYATTEELEAIQNLLSENNIEAVINRANKVKESNNE